MLNPKCIGHRIRLGLLLGGENDLIGASLMRTGKIITSAVCPSGAIASGHGLAPVPHGTGSGCVTPLELSPGASVLIKSIRPHAFVDGAIRARDASNP